MVSEHVYTHCVMKLSNIEGNIVLYSHTFVLRTYMLTFFSCLGPHHKLSTFVFVLYIVFKSKIILPKDLIKYQYQKTHLLTHASIQFRHHFTSIPFDTVAVEVLIAIRQRI